VVNAARAARTPKVEVRRGRRGRELRIDGTFASYYEPGLSITGSVWDALGAPLLLLPRHRRRRVLVLGLGGGSVARVVRALAPRAKIVGVEKDRRVLAAARRDLELDSLGIEVIESAAEDFLARSRRSFDFIIEDVFIGRGRNVHKPEWLPSPGLSRAVRRLERGGLLVSNTIDESTEVARALGGLFPSIVRIVVEGYDNRVLVAGPPPLTAPALRAAVASDRVLAATLPRLNFRTLKGAPASQA
jgi:spermidine synthase